MLRINNFKLIIKIYNANDLQMEYELLKLAFGFT